MEVVRGYLQAYDWGATDGLAEWVGKTGGPQAELWFGTHPNGVSPLADGSGPARASLPILTKVLAAGRPLSIQIHPAAELARRWLPDRPDLLSDANGKAEILIALEPFQILEGFRAPEVAAAILRGLGLDFAAAAEAMANGDLRAAIRQLLVLGPGEVAGGIPRLTAALRDAGLPEHDVDVMSLVAHTYPDDPGVFVAALLNARTLAPGQAVYVDPGTVHAYVRGLGLEVMTNSDNVLRLGLTSKTVAVDEALEAADIAAQPHLCTPESDDGLQTFAPPDAPFEVQLVKDAVIAVATGRARTVLCLGGTTTIGDAELGPGEAALLTENDPDVVVAVDGRAAIAQQAAR